MKSNKPVILAVVIAIIGLLFCLCCGVGLVWVSKFSLPGSTPDLIVFVDVEVPEEVRDQVFVYLKEMPNVLEIRVLDNVEATKNYIEHLENTNPDDPLLDYLDSPILPHTFEIYLKNDYVHWKEEDRSNITVFLNSLIEQYELDQDSLSVI